MYSIGLSETYAWPVKVVHPKNGGGVDERSFDAVFKRLSQSQIDDANERSIAGNLNDRQFCREVVVGWTGVQDADGNELPFSETNLALLLNIQGMAATLVRAFYASLSGGKEKN